MYVRNFEEKRKLSKRGKKGTWRKRPQKAMTIEGFVCYCLGWIEENLNVDVARIELFEFLGENYVRIDLNEIIKLPFSLVQATKFLVKVKENKEKYKFDGEFSAYNPMFSVTFFKENGSV